jgi:hypothetical protein
MRAIVNMAAGGYVRFSSESSRPLRRSTSAPAAVLPAAGAAGSNSTGAAVAALQPRTNSAPSASSVAPALALVGPALSQAAGSAAAPSAQRLSPSGSGSAKSIAASTMASHPNPDPATVRHFPPINSVVRGVFDALKAEKVTASCSGILIQQAT